MSDFNIGMIEKGRGKKVDFSGGNNVYIWYGCGIEIFFVSKILKQREKKKKPNRKEMKVKRDGL